MTVGESISTNAAEAIDKMLIYAALGVSELWRFNGRTLAVYELGPDRQYVPRQSSPAFPGFPVAEIARLLNDSAALHETALIRSFRERVRGI
jgi:hypothetical protein